MDETTRRSWAFSKEDCRRLQVLQNKALRLIVKTNDRCTPTNSLLEWTNELSVHQLGAFHSCVTAFRIMRSGKPEYLANQLSLRNNDVEEITGRNSFKLPHQSYDLSVGRCGFIYRVSKLWNQLPLNLRSEQRTSWDCVRVTAQVGLG